MARGLLLIVLAALLSLAGLAGYQLLRTGLAADVYRARLEETVRDYEILRGQYNQAVRRTAVTELVVEDGKLAVVIRDAGGILRRIETPFDPSREIYVDFVLLDGRLWIRRVFDDRTPPEQGVLIDPALAEIDWSEEPEAYGKAAYRALGPGRWVVSVTGDGSLGLAQASEDAVIELAPPPPVRDYEPIESALDGALRDLAPAEVLRALSERLGWNLRS
ncbi:MAG TPA: hypothetical protein VII72_15710 [Myxococcota bacterium]